MAIIKHGTTTLYVDDPYITPEQAAAMLTPPDGPPVDPAQVTITPEPHEVREIVRRAIHAKAGDAESLLGTTADAAQIALVTLAELLSALETAQSLADVRAAVTGCTALAALKQLLADRQAGACKLPYEVKGGADAVMPEIEQRATIAADAIKAGPKAV